MPSLGDPDQSDAPLPQFNDAAIPPVGDQAAGFGLKPGGKRFVSFAVLEPVPSSDQVAATTPIPG